MPVIIRSIWLILMLWLLVAGLTVPGLVLLVTYLLYFTGYELVLMVFLVDVYHGALLDWPWFTILVLILTIFVELLKPRLLLYTGKNEIVS